MYRLATDTLVVVDKLKFAIARKVLFHRFNKQSARRERRAHHTPVSGPSPQAYGGAGRGYNYALLGYSSDAIAERNFTEWRGIGLGSVTDKLFAQFNVGVSDCTLQSGDIAYEVQNVGSRVPGIQQFKVILW